MPERGPTLVRSTLGRLRRWVGRWPVAGTELRRLRARRRRRAFPGAAAYWERRYAAGGDSGDGSAGRLAAFKARTVNRLLDRWRIRTVLDLGCGDGRQAASLRCPAYVGFDVSPTALRLCRRRFAGDASKRFRLYDPSRFAREAGAIGADAALSLDVLFHLTEDDVYESYLRHLFDAAGRLVVVYSSDTDANDVDQPPHVRHRRFTSWVSRHRPGWTLVERVRNPHPLRPGDPRGSFAEFFVYARRDSS